MSPLPNNVLNLLAECVFCTQNVASTRTHTLADTDSQTIGFLRQWPLIDGVVTGCPL